MKKITTYCFLCLCVYSSCFAGYDDGLNRAKYVKITIDYTKVGVGATNVPILLTEANFPDGFKTSGGSDACQTDGGDIRASSSDPLYSNGAGVTAMPLEIVTLSLDATPANSDIEIWVKVPSVSDSADTDIWIAWQTPSTATQPTASATAGKYNVWPSVYKLVSHDGGLNDSTSNQHNGTNFSTGTSTSGIIGSCRTYNGSSQYVSHGDHADWSFTDGSGNDTSCTVLYWGYYTTNAGLAVAKFGADATPPCDWEWLISNSYALFGNLNMMYYIGRSSATYSNPSAWNQQVSVYSGSETEAGVDIYINGVVADDTSLSLTPASYTGMTNTTSYMNIGRRAYGDAYYNGSIDEVWIIKGAAMAAGTVETHYNNHSAPASFATEGTVQTAGPAPAGDEFIPIVIWM